MHRRIFEKQVFFAQILRLAFVVTIQKKVEHGFLDQVIVNVLKTLFYVRTESISYKNDPIDCVMHTVASI
jgi:hypothetical protein